MPLQDELVAPPAMAARVVPELAGLGQDWLLVTGARLGGEPIDMVLLHPRCGVALLQMAPRWTLDAPERLRHRLAQARFGAIFNGHLPVVHRMLRPQDIADLPRLLAEAFAGQPPLDLPAGDAWMRVVHRALVVRPMEIAELPGPPRRQGACRRLPVTAGLGLAGVLAAVAVLARPGPSAAPEPLATLATVLGTGDAAAGALAGALAAAPAEAAVAPAEAATGPEEALGLAEDGGRPDAGATALEAVRGPEPEGLQAVPAIGEPAAAAPPAPVVVAGPDAWNAAALLPERPSPPPLPGLPAGPLVPLPDPASSGTGLPSGLGLVSPATVPAPPAASLAMVPPATVPPGIAPPPPRIAADAALLGVWLRRGEALLAIGDVSAARRFFERVAEAGSAAGALAMGRTHDPVVLAGLRARGISPDPVAAAAWYRRARELEAMAMMETAR